MKLKLKDLARIHQALTLLDKGFDLSGGAVVGMARNFRLIRGELTSLIGTGGDIDLRIHHNNGGSVTITPVFCNFVVTFIGD